MLLNHLFGAGCLIHYPASLPPSLFPSLFPCAVAGGLSGCLDKKKACTALVTVLPGCVQNPPNIKMEPPKSNFNITGAGGGAF